MRESVREITESGRQAERDLSGFHWYNYTFVLLDDDESRARERAAAFLGAGFRGVPGQDYAPLVDKVAAVGNTATVTSRLQSYVDAGVRHFISPCWRAARSGARCSAGCSTRSLLNLG